jgi:hypothetical protein
MAPIMIYYTRKCISCLNKVVIAVPVGFTYSQAPCPYCRAVVRIWP